MIQGLAPATEANNYLTPQLFLVFFKSLIKQMTHCYHTDSANRFSAVRDSRTNMDEELVSVKSAELRSLSLIQP